MRRPSKGLVERCRTRDVVDREGDETDASGDRHGVFLVTMHERTKQIVLGLATLQVLDAIGNEIPRKLVHNHLNHLGVPPRLRPLLSPIKVTTAAALVAGIERPRLRAITSAGLVAYYAAAARFHLLA